MKHDEIDEEKLKKELVESVKETLEAIWQSLISCLPDDYDTN